jgi:hypothetical protein
MPLSSQTNTDRKRLAKKGHSGNQPSNIDTNYDKKSSSFIQIRGSKCSCENTKNDDGTTLFIEEMTEGKKNMKQGKSRPATQAKQGKSKPATQAKQGKSSPASNSGSNKGGKAPSGGSNKGGKAPSGGSEKGGGGAGKKDCKCGEKSKEKGGQKSKDKSGSNSKKTGKQTTKAGDKKKTGKDSKKTGDKKKTGKDSKKTGDKKKTGKDSKKAGTKKKASDAKKSGAAKKSSDKKKKAQATKKAKAKSKSDKKAKEKAKSSKKAAKSKTKKSKFKFDIKGAFDNILGINTGSDHKNGPKEKKKKAEKKTPGEACKPNGEGGKNCFPIEKFPVKEAKERMGQCCRPCQENFQNELSFLQLPKNVEKKAQNRYNAWSSFHHLNSHLHFNHKKIASIPAKIALTATPSLAFVELNLLNKRTNSPKKPAEMANGEQIQQMLPCCPVCPEEFYAPSDFADLSAFVEFKESLAIRQTHHREPDKNSIDNDSSNSKGSISDNLFRFIGIEENINAGTQDKTKQKSKEGVDTLETCCKICPGDRYPGLGLDALQPTFLETMELKGDGNACCPICPTLSSLSLGGAEPFGGPFGEGVGNMAHAMTKAIQSICKCYPNCPESIIQSVKGCRPQDIRTTLTGFIEVGEKEMK